MSGKNLLFILSNGEPDEWALVRGLPEEPEEDVWVGVYEVSDEVADHVSDGGKPLHLWDDIIKGRHVTVEWDGETAHVHKHWPDE